VIGRHGARFCKIGVEVDGTVAAIASLMKTPRPGDVNCNLVLGGAGMQGSNGDLSMPA
jgi:hypothetical protein